MATTKKTDEAQGATTPAATVAAEENQSLPAGFGAKPSEMDDALAELALAKTQEEEAIAKSRIALLAVVEGQEHSDAIFWTGIPPQYAGWRFYRCGIRGNSNAEAIAADMINRFGYIRAPRSVKIYGAFHGDGDNGIYLMAPPETVANVRKALDILRARKSARRRGTLGSLLDDMRRELRGKVELKTVRKSDGMEVDPAEVFDAGVSRSR